MKECKSCHQVKSLFEFYSQPKNSDGRAGICKECHKVRIKISRNQNIEHVRQYDRDRGMLPHRVQARSEYQKSHRPLVNQIKASWIKLNPEKRKAHMAVQQAIRSGKLTRLPCEVCGSIKSQAHHTDYDKPLEVKWRCRKHHHRGIF